MVVGDIAARERPRSECAQVRPSRRWGFVACAFVVVLIFWHIRNLMDVEDSVTYFAYFNNSSVVHVPFYYGGYVALYSQLAAYLASLLAFPWQPFVYMCAAALIGVYFVYQLLVFIDDVLKAPLVSAAIAFVLVALMVKTHGTFNLFVNLTYNIWIGWLGLYIRILNALRGREAGIVTIVLGVLSAWSHSYSVVLIPALLGALVLPLTQAGVTAHRSRLGLSVELGVYLMAAVLFPLLLIEPGFPKPLPSVDLGPRLLHMLLDVHSNTALTILIGLLLVAIALPPALRSLKALVRWASIARDDYLLLVMAFVGVGTVAIVFASGRVFVADKIWARYLFTPILSLFLASLVVASYRPWFRGVVARIESHLQGFLALPIARVASGLVVVGVLAATSILPWHTLRNNIARTIDTERFLAAAETYRATCQDGAFIQSWDKWSLAVLCHRRDLPKDSEAVSLNEDHVTVWGGGQQSRTADHAKPDVPMLFQPLDVMSLPGR